MLYSTQTGGVDLTKVPTFETTNFVDVLPVLDKVNDLDPFGAHRLAQGLFSNDLGSLYRFMNAVARER